MGDIATVDLNKRCENSAAPMDGRRSCRSFPGCGCTAAPLPSSVKPSDEELARFNELAAHFALRVRVGAADSHERAAAELPRLAASRLSVPTVPEGWVLLPNHPTNEMLHAYFAVIDANHALGLQAMLGRYDNFPIAWAAFCKAAPLPKSPA